MLHRHWTCPNLCDSDHPALNNTQHLIPRAVAGVDDNAAFWRGCILTGSMDMQSVDDIPMLGISQWPLDHFWKRVLKRGEDLLGATVGLLLTAPLMAVAALLIKRESPGPVFYSQERCGEKLGSAG